MLKIHQRRDISIATVLEIRNRDLKVEGLNHDMGQVTSSINGTFPYSAWPCSFSGIMHYHSLPSLNFCYCMSNFHPKDCNLVDYWEEDMCFQRLE